MKIELSKKILYIELLRSSKGKCDYFDYIPTDDIKVLQKAKILRKL